jgi:hypothetical protein
VDFTKALTYPFDDPDWLKKLGIGLLLSFIPIVGTIPLQGWQLEIVKRVRSNHPTPLPDWDFGGMFSKGLILFLAWLVYLIPAMILGCLAGFGPTVLAGVAAGSDNGGAAGGLATVVMACCGCLSFLLLLAGMVVYFGGYIRFVDREEFGTFMQFSDNIAMVRDHLSDFATAVLIIMAGAFVFGLVGSFVIVGGLLATIFTTYFGGHILGQLAAKVGGMAASPAV